MNVQRLPQCHKQMAFSRPSSEYFLSPGRPEQWTWKALPSVTKKQPFQDHLLSKTIILTHWKSVYQETWTMKVQGFLCILLFVFQIMSVLTLQHKYGCHIAKMSHTTIMLNRQIVPACLPMSKTAQPTATVTLHIIVKYVPETNMPSNTTYMPNIPITPCTHTRQLWQYLYFIWMQCKQQCNQDYCYTYISHYWHMLLNKLPAILPMYVLLH